jgi:hypothetical protein
MQDRVEAMLWAERVAGCIQASQGTNVRRSITSQNASPKTEA